MAKKPPATEEEYYLALGSALSVWGNVESALNHILMHLLRPCDPHLTGRVFFAVSNFRDRLNMVDAAAEYQLKGKPDLKDWRNLKYKTADRSRKRNEIAHAVAWVGPEIGAYGSRPMPYLVDLPVSWKRRKQLVLTPRALKVAERSFDDLFRDLIAFRSRLLKHST